MYNISHNLLSNINNCSLSPQQLLKMHRDSMAFIDNKMSTPLNPDLAFWKERCTDFLASHLQNVDHSYALTAHRMFLPVLDEILRNARAAGLVRSVSDASSSLPSAVPPAVPGPSTAGFVPAPMPPPPTHQPLFSQQQQQQLPQQTLMTAEQWQALHQRAPQHPPAPPPLTLQQPHPTPSLVSTVVPAQQLPSLHTLQPAAIQQGSTLVQMRGTPPAGASTPNTTAPLMYGDLNWSVDSFGSSQQNPPTPNTSLQE